jgi:uncharacterized membrane protein YbhN (UPF0104 family)
MSRAVHYFRRYSVLIGIVILGVIVARVNFDEAATMVRRLPASAIGIAGLAYGVNVLIKAFRWHRMIRQLQIPIAMGVSVSAFLSGALYGMLTVGRLGELLRVEALLDKCPSRARALATCIVDRLLDVIFLGVVALVGSTQALGLPLTIVGLIATAVGLWGLRRIADLLRARRSEKAAIGAGPDETPKPKWLANKWVGKLILGSTELMFVTSDMVTTVHAFENVFWTALSWSGYFAAVIALTAGLGCEVPWFATIAVAAVAAISAALPISFQGVGTREAAFALAFAPYGMTVTQAVTLSFSLLALFYVVTVPMGVIGVVWRRSQQKAEAAAAANSTG